MTKQQRQNSLSNLWDLLENSDLTNKNIYKNENSYLCGVYELQKIQRYDAQYYIYEHFTNDFIDVSYIATNTIIKYYIDELNKTKELK